MRDISRTLGLLNDATLEKVLVILQGLAANPACRRPIPSRSVIPIQLVKRQDPFSASLLTEHPSHYFFADPGGRTLHISPELAKYLDATPDRLLHEGWEKFIDGADELKRVLELWMVHAQTKEKFTYTVRCKSTFGRIEYVLVRVRPVFDATNTLTNWVGTIHPYVLPARVLDDFAAAREEKTG